ncbi:MAG TPA: ABC transporter permease subunit, partial [Anaerolineaceae bacterium]|nr:ABC transporter permease subunit [Anaerolineaceae bacterium]
MKETSYPLSFRQATLTGIRQFWLNRRTLWLGLAAAAVIWASAQAGLWSGPLVNPGGWGLVTRLLDGLLHPRLDAAFLRLTLESTLVTLAYAVSGTVLSLLLGFVGGVLSSEVWWRARRRPTESSRAPWLVVRGLLAIPRAIHEVVWGLFFVSILGLAPLVGILAIAIPFGSICAKVFSEILDEQPRDAFLAILNSGVSPAKAFFYGLLPQALPNLISYSFYRFECSIRSATVLGLIGAGGLGFQILLSLQSLRYEEMLPLLLALLMLSGVTDLWSARLRLYIGGSSRIDLNWNSTRQGKTIARQYSGTSSAFVRFSLVALLLLTVFAFLYLKPDFTSLAAPRTTQLFAGLVQDAFPPRLSLVSRDQLVRLTLQTLSISILAMTGAGVLGIAAAFLGAHLSWKRKNGFSDLLVRLFTRGLLLFARAVPTPIWALIVLFVLFPGALPGAISLGIHNWGIAGRLMAESVENMSEKPLQALQGLGASDPQVILYGAL